MIEEKEEPLTLAAYDAKINEVQTAQDIPITGSLLRPIQGQYFPGKGKGACDMSSQMLSGVKVKYGRDSNEYGMAGGTRLSEIDHHPRGGGE